ncbi:MAG: hypothetical protein DRG78_03715 [Epsilonproteobacteria bacterium]|nr:MAG: hypothetical protein DRG78_03715 [Campylobacterota bacterium]
MDNEQKTLDALRIEGLRERSIPKTFRIVCVKTLISKNLHITEFKDEELVLTKRPKVLTLSVILGEFVGHSGNSYFSMRPTCFTLMDIDYSSAKFRELAYQTLRVTNSLEFYVDDLTLQPPLFSEGSKPHRTRHIVDLTDDCIRNLRQTFDDINDHR